MTSKSKKASRGSARVRLEPQDSFDLIRLLARSQSDARKAVGELVQNSLDAGARRVDVTWFNEKGRRALRIEDDGQGIFPDLSREDALRMIAQTVGHSHKHALSPAQRHEQMVLGKYGIGLLGFWCIARMMEVRSRVGGGEAWVLRLVEDQREAEVFKARSQRTLVDDTFTRITLFEVKESVQRQVRPPRLQAYLAGELRGQLLQRGTEVRLYDRVARGRAKKEFLVRPRAYLGLPLDDLRVLEVPDHENARLELYHVPEDEERRGVVSLSCGGTTVIDDIARMDPTEPEGREREPWASGRFEGVIDFPDLSVAPGTRRGFVPDDAALEFLIALEKLEAELAKHLDADARERARTRREKVAREIRRAFRSVAQRLPQYDLLDVRGTKGDEERDRASADAPDGERLGDADALDSDTPPDSGSPPEADPDPVDEVDGDVSLFPPGPLHVLRIRPKRCALAPGTMRVLRAHPEDEDGRSVSQDVEIEWRLDGDGSLEADGRTASYRAPTEVAPDESIHARLVARARQADREVEAEVPITVTASIAARERTSGIPEPEPVNAPSEPWRSRLVGSRWEYNEGHRDYLAVARDDGRRLAYLKHLFAKEIVQRNFGSGADGEVLERMVEVLTYLGRR